MTEHTSPAETTQTELLGRPTGTRKTVLYVFFGSLILHFLYLSQYATTPFFWVPRLDHLYHDLLAQQITRGLSDDTAYFRAPGYYMWLAGLYKIFGASVDARFWAARMAQAAVGAASCSLVYALGKRLFTPLIGLLAAVGMALYGPLVFHDGELHTPVLEVFLDLVFLLLAVRAVQSQKQTDWLLSGLVLGLSAIVRPNILVAVPVLLWWQFTQRPQGASAPRWWATAAALFLVGVLVFPGLVTLRNLRVSGDPVFIASQGGINLYLGNRPGADGFTPSTPTRYRFNTAYEDSVALYGQKAAEEAVGHSLKASEVNRYWIDRSAEFWREDPASALKLTGKKWVLAWSRQEVRNNTAFDFARKELAPLLWLCPLGFWFAGPLGLLGMVMAWRVHPASRLLTLFALTYTASYVAFFVSDRYRLPVVPVLLLFSAYAIVHLRELAQQRNTRALAPWLGLLVVFAVFVNVPWFPTSTPATWALDYWSMGNRYQAQRRYQEAAACQVKAIALDPKNADIWNSLGEAQYYSQQFTNAAVSFQNAIQFAPENSQGYYNLSLCAMELKRPDMARKLLEKVLSLEPEHAAARRGLAELKGRG
jgi:tetratricopeptide (TPR) repeat protein